MEELLKILYGIILISVVISITVGAFKIVINFENTVRSTDIVKDKNPNLLKICYLIFVFGIIALLAIEAFTGVHL